jgi:hypothetical protein
MGLLKCLWLKKEYWDERTFLEMLGKFKKPGSAYRTRKATDRSFYVYEQVIGAAREGIGIWTTEKEMEF